MKFGFNIRHALKINQILTDEAIEKFVEVQKAEGLRIPVTMRGTCVGWGELQRDGTFIVETESSPEGRELMQRILNGTANCISITPNPNGPVRINTEGI